MPTTEDPSPDRRMPDITAESGHRSLLDHATEKATMARHRHGADLDWARFEALLQDAAVVRYPTTVEFTAAGLAAGMFATARQRGERPGDGFVIHVHPHFRGREADLPLLVAYHLVAVNYGDIADASVAERFGATLFGLEVDDYYARLCALADELR